MNQAEKERLARVGKTFNAKKYIKEEIEAIKKQVGFLAARLAFRLLDRLVCGHLTCTHDAFRCFLRNVDLRPTGSSFVTVTVYCDGGLYFTACALVSSGFF